MLGFAQKQFIKEGGSLPNRPRSKYAPHTSWPLLDSMLAKGRLSYVDYALAEKLMRDYPYAGQEVAAFICHLSTATREGHLCIRIDTNVFPDPRLSWSDTGDSDMTSDESSPTDNDFETLSQLIIKGSQNLPKGLLASAPNYSDAPICHFQDLFYFQRYWYEESVFIENSKKMLLDAPRIQLDNDLLSLQLSVLEQNKQLLPEQAKAIKTACAKSLTLICGGPGTGKTYTAGYLLKVYWESMTPDQRQQCEIELAAPTGKAAANLQQSISRAVGNLEGFKPIKARTLHSLLGLRGTIVTHETPKSFLSADLLLVDESSMIDVHLMSRLIASMKPGARLILLGDPYQLPPVSAGMLFSDMVSSFSENVITLNKCLRTELRTIVEFAGTVKEGDSTNALQMLSSKLPGIDQLVLQEDKIASTQKALFDHAIPFFTVKNTGNPQQLLETFNRFRILSPLRKGPLGFATINDQISRLIMQKQCQESSIVLPIMLVNSDHRLELFNGEVGVLVRRPPKEGAFGLQKGDYAYFPDRSGDKDAIRKIPALLLPKYEYAYCLSVHKSQGSEFDEVLLLMPQGAEIFGREVLYTAITRARKKIEIWSTLSTLQETISRRSQRLSGISIKYSN